MRTFNQHLTQSGGPIWFPKEVQFELRSISQKGVAGEHSRPWGQKLQRSPAKWTPGPFWKAM